MITLWKRHRASIAVGLAVVLALTLTVLTSAGVSTNVDLDPDNPRPNGAQALARVLAEQGVDVEVARGASALEDAQVGAGTTVLVTSSNELGPTTTDDLTLLSTDAALVIADPAKALTKRLGVERLPAVAGGDPLVADCQDPRFQGLEVYADVARPLRGPGCFPVDDGALLVEVNDGLTLLGAGDLLTNEQIVLADNAAVALRLLGGTQRLVWYVPDATDLGGADSFSLADVLPPWLAPGGWILGLAGLGLLLWRVRRLGPLSSEPLPVTVKAIESTQSRGRLYRRAGDRGHAARVLRAATARRLSEQLRLGRVPTDTLIRSVASHLGEPTDRISALLTPQSPPPATDRDLVELGTQLSTLEEEVRHR